MIDRWIEHLYNLYGGYGYYYLQSGVPNDVAYGLHIAVISFFAVWAFYDRNNFIKKAIILLLADYILFLFCSTIIFRTGSAETGWRLMPFWKYRGIVNGYDQYVMEIILNILVFIPIGFLAGCLWYGKDLKKVIGLGLVVSLVIELGQLVFEKGLAEIDDLIHNTLGCAIGYLIAIPIAWIYNRVTKKKIQMLKDNNI